MSYIDNAATEFLATCCAICGRPLLDPESIQCGIGPVCREKYGFYDDVASPEARTEALRLVYAIAVKQNGPEVEQMVVRIRALGYTRMADIIITRLGGLPTLAFVDGAFLLTFPYSAAMVSAVKTAADKVGGRRRFDGATKGWVMDVVAARAMGEVFATAGRALLVTDGAAEALAATPVVAAPAAKRSEGTVKVAGGFVTVATPYNAGAVQALKGAARGKARYNGGDKSWTFPVSVAADVATALTPFFPGVAAEIATHAPVGVAAPTHREMSKAANSAGAGAAQAQVDAVRAQLAAVLPAGKTLYPYQEVGIAFLEATNGRALVADEMGLGKTVQALGWIALHSEVKKVLIIAPASLTLNWAREAGRWVPGRSVHVVKTSKSAMTASPDIVVASYEMAVRRRAEFEALGFDAVVIDEAHNLKNQKAARTKAILGEWK